MSTRAAAWRITTGGVTVESVQSFNSAWEILGPSIGWFSGVITEERAHRLDLIQEARIELWRLDATRFVLSDKAEVAYLRKCLINRMWTVWGRNREATQETLDSIMAGVGATQSPY